MERCKPKKLKRSCSPGMRTACKLPQLGKRAQHNWAQVPVVSRANGPATVRKPRAPDTAVKGRTHTRQDQASKPKLDPLQQAAQPTDALRWGSDPVSYTHLTLPTNREV